MKYITQILYILLFSLLGELLQAVIPLPVPAAIYGLILLLIALSTGLLKEEKITEVSDFMIRYMPSLFVAPAAKLLQYWHLISPHISAICIITAVSTVIVFTVSGLVAKWIINRRERRNNG